MTLLSVFNLVCIVVILAFHLNAQKESLDTSFSLDKWKDGVDE